MSGPARGSMNSRQLAQRADRERRIMERAATPGGWGVKDFGGASETLSADAKRMTADGRLIPVDSCGGHRYFASQDLARAFEARKRAVPRGRPAGPGTKSGAQFKTSDKAYIPDHVQIQRIPSPPGRYAVAGPIVGGFMSDWLTKRGASA